MTVGTDHSDDARRPWRGVGPDERQARRREQLVAAGFVLMGTDGAAAVSMRGVSRQAKLTERYFYESFASREELLVAVLESVTVQARTAILGALEQAPADVGGLIRHVVGAFTEFITADPRRGRVLFVESLAAPELTRRGAELVAEFTGPIAEALRGSVLGGAERDDSDVELNAQAVFGALAYLYQAWLAGHVTVSRERFVEHVAQVIENVAQATSMHSPR
jgi:AcrR family transcriptional regulator